MPHKQEYTHNHSHEHGHSHTSMEKASLVSLVLNIIFVIIEVIGGLYSNSISILSDAVHDFGDVLSLGFSFILIKISKKKRTSEHTFGFSSLIIVGALINTLVILTTSSIIFINAIQRLGDPKIVDGRVMFFLAVFGVLINGISVYKFLNQNNVMSRSLMLHLLEDTLGWVAVLISSIFIYLFNVYILDTLLSIAIAMFLFFNCLKNIKKIIDIMLYKVPSNINVNEIKNSIIVFEEVEEINNVRIWTIDGEINYFISNIIVNKNIELIKLLNLKKEIKTKLKEQNIQHIYLDFNINEDKNEK